MAWKWSEKSYYFIFGWVKLKGQIGIYVEWHVTLATYHTKSIAAKQVEMECFNYAWTFPKCVKKMFAIHLAQIVSNCVRRIIFSFWFQFEKKGKNIENDDDLDCWHLRMPTMLKTRPHTQTVHTTDQYNLLESKDKHCFLSHLFHASSYAHAHTASSKSVLCLFIFK